MLAIECLYPFYQKGAVIDMIASKTLFFAVVLCLFSVGEDEIKDYAV